jgi:hypothetical protein
MNDMGFYGFLWSLDLPPCQGPFGSSMPLLDSLVQEISQSPHTCAICIHIVQGELCALNSQIIAASSSTVCCAWKIKWYNSYSYDHTLAPPITGKCQFLNLILSFRASYSEIQIVVTRKKLFYNNMIHNILPAKILYLLLKCGVNRQEKEVLGLSWWASSSQSLSGFLFEVSNHHWWHSASRFFSITI